MKLYIPTYQRHDVKLADTLRHWPQGLPVTAVVQPQEEHEYRLLLKMIIAKQVDLMVLPPYVKGIAATRQHIVNVTVDRYLCMIDDDLGFLARNRDDHAYYLGQASPNDIALMFHTMKNALEQGFAHVAISMREGNNRVEKEYLDVGRGIRVVAYDRYALDQHDLKFDLQLEGREDLDMTLQLLRKGLPNRIFYKWAQGQRSSNSAGGLSETAARTPEELRRTAELLAKKHDPFVTVVEKHTTTSWGGITRADVKIQWQKAYRSRVS